MTSSLRPVVRVEAPPDRAPFGEDGDRIHAVLVTGKSLERARLVRVSIASFLAQTHPNRVLVVVNDGDFEIEVPDVPGGHIVFLRPEGRRPLGALRNLALDVIPDGGLWTPWDDDDWRHPRLLASQHRVLRSLNVEACLLRTQINYFVPTDVAFIHWHDGGFSGTVLTRNRRALRHPEWARDEDSAYVAEIKQSVSWYPWNNPPHYMVRFVHGANTGEARNFGPSDLERGTWRLDSRSSETLRCVLPLYESPTG